MPSSHLASVAEGWGWRGQWMQQTSQRGFCQCRERESGIKRERERLPRHVRREQWTEEKKSRQNASRKEKEGAWYLERGRKQRGCLATTSHCSVEWDSRRRNSSYVSVQCCFCSAKSRISTALQIQREPCLRVTGSCVKLVLASVNVTALSNLPQYRLLL